MKLNSLIIYDNLKKHVSCEFFGKKEPALQLGRPEFYNRSGAVFLKNHVYILRGDQLPSRTKVEPEALIICVGKSIYLSYYTGKCSVIQVDGACDLPELFNILTRIYDRFDRWADTLQEILNTTANLNSMVTASRYIFENPIIVLNANFRYLAHTELNQKELASLNLNSWGDPDSTELPLENLNIFMENHELSTNVKEPLLIRLFESTTLNVNLFENGEYSGCVTIDYQHRPYQESDDVLADYLARRIEVALKRYSSAAGNEQSELRQALISMMDGYQITLQQRRVIDTSYLRMQHVCIRLKFDSSLNQLPISYLCNELESEFRRSVAFEYDNSIVAFIEISAEQAEDKSFFTLLYRRLTPMTSSFDCHIGISEPFSDIYQGRLYYCQACAALENGLLFDPENVFYPFDRYILRELLINAIGNLPLEMYFTEGLRRLLQHDEESAVSYVQTLKAYLDHNMNVTHTAAALYLNRSTLLERLSRIKRILGVDPEDSRERLLLNILLSAMEIHEQLHTKRTEE